MPDSVWLVYGEFLLHVVFMCAYGCDESDCFTVLRCCWKYAPIVTLAIEQSLLLASMSLALRMFPGCLKVELP